MTKLIYRENQGVLNCKINETLDSYEILKKDYSYLLKSMEKESFILENPKCNLFKELLYENFVVGFCSYNFDNGIYDLSLNEIYILPTYRGNHFLFNEIINALQADISISIFEPNNLIIDLLIKYGFAEKLNDYLVASAIPLDVPNEHYILNDNSKRLNDDDNYSSNLYDTSISATLCLVDISSYNTNIIAYSKLLDSDVKFYDAKKHRQNLNNKHFESIKEDMVKNQDEFVATIIRLKDNLPKVEYDIDDLIGNPFELSDTLNSFVSDGILSLERVKTIHKQILEEYNEGKVLNKSLWKRLQYLCIEDQIDEEDDDYFDFGMICPYCHNPINLSEDSCSICGYALNHDIFYDEEDEEAILREILKETMNNDDNSFLNPYTKIRDYLPNNDSIEEKQESNQFKYAVLTLLSHLIEESDFGKYCMIVGLYGFEDYELYDYFLSEGFVSHSVSNANWEIVSNNLTIPQLKDILRSEGLKISGKKSELVKRISANIDLSKLSIKDEYGQDAYFITKKGLDYLEENRHIFNYNKYLKSYDLNEFLEYHQKNDEKDPILEILNFIRMNEEEAIQKKDRYKYRLTLDSKRRVYDLEKLNDEKYKNEQINDELKMYCLNLNNKKHKSPVHLNNRLDTPNIKLIRNYYKEVKFDYESLISEIYRNSFYDKEYSLDDTIYILSEIVKGKTIAELNKKLKGLNKDDYSNQNYKKTLDDFL